MMARWGPAAVVSTVALLAMPWLLGPQCPTDIVIATGSQDGAYFAFANRYREILAKEGITLEVRATAGSVENRRLLREGEVSLSLIQGGTATADVANDDARVLESLASLYLEPIWVFCRSDKPVDDLKQLRGRRISIGPDGSGTQSVALKLLADNRMAPDPKRADSRQFVRWKTTDSVEGLKSGKIDAAFFVISADSPIVADLLQTEGIELMNFRRATAYQRSHAFLSSVTVPEGLINYQKNIPARDIVLLAPATNLVARSDLHHALIPLLLQTIEEVHSQGGLLTNSGAFPSPDFVEYPLHRDASQYFRSGPSLFYRSLPFWLAAWLDRAKLMLLPLCTLLLPLLKVAPPIYRWRIRSKIYRWYRVLREVDQKLKEAEADTDFGPDVENLKSLESELAEVSVPLSYMAEFYNLHLHISFVREKLRKHDEQADTKRLRISA